MYKNELYSYYFTISTRIKLDAMLMTRRRVFKKVN